MEKTNRQILEERAKLGQEAQHAMNLYLTTFFKERELVIYTEFVNASFDEAKIVELKRMQMALAELEGQVLSDISVGRAADIELKTLP